MSNKSIAIIFVGFFLLLVVVLFVLLLHVKDNHPEPPADANSTTSNEILQDQNTSSNKSLFLNTDSIPELPSSATESLQTPNSSALRSDPIHDFLSGSIAHSYQCSSCPEKRNSSYFCDPKLFAVIVKISDNGTLLLTTNQSYYQVQVERVLKEVDGLQTGLDRMLIYTEVPTNIPCNLNLIQDQTYLVTGKILNRNAVTSVCDLIINWDQVPAQEQQIFEGFFAKQDQCSLSSDEPEASIKNTTSLVIIEDKPDSEQV